MYEVHFICDLGSQRDIAESLSFVGCPAAIRWIILDILIINFAFISLLRLEKLKARHRLEEVGVCGTQ